MLRAVTWASIALFLSSCAVIVKMPVNRLDSPETQGKNRIKINAALAGTSDIVLSPNLATNVPATDAPTYLDSTRFYLGGGFGLMDNLDLELRTHGMLQAKYQFLGAPRARAEGGNFPLAITAGLGLRNRTDTGTANNSSSSNEMKEFMFDVAFIGGYRIATALLLYGGVFFHSNNVTGTAVSQGVYAETAYSGKGTSTGLNLGLELGAPVFQLRVEGASAEVKMGSTKRNIARFGVELGFSFAAG